MRLRTVLRGALALIAILSSFAAQAQVFRAYLSVNGSDTNPCSIQLPCRLLPRALETIVDGGEVWMLDSANYNTGPVAVDKSASILAVPGAVGSVVALGGPAVDISASGLKVSLRNLVIAPFPGTSGFPPGIRMTGASALTIENSVIANLPNNGVQVTGAGTLKITDTVIRSNGGYAVELRDGPSAEISRTEMLANVNGGVGVQSDTVSTSVTVSDSVISGGFQGVHLINFGAGTNARGFVTRCTIEGTGTGLAAETGGGAGSAVIAVSYSMIVNISVYAWYLNGTGSVIRTLGNNHFTDNNSSQGVLTPAGLQ
jgi:hypothetical protein